MERSDVERIVRDVLTSQGVRAALVQVERETDGWRVTVTDQAHRVVSTHIHDGAPAAIRAALLAWVDGQS